VLLFSFEPGPAVCCEREPGILSRGGPLHSLPLATPEPAQVVFELVLRHSCSVSGLDEGVLRKRLLLLFF
jgi:hypothetical protein